MDAASGQPLEALDYLPFGGTQRRSGAPITIRGFTGQSINPSTGLYNYNARLYDPALGRFYATDRARQYASPYTYVGNNPFNATDPNGTLSQALSKLIADNWSDDDDALDFFVLDELFGIKDMSLLNEYYNDALPNLIWNKSYNQTDIIVAFGRNDNGRLEKFTQSFTNSTVKCHYNTVKFYECLPGQGGFFFGKNEYRHLFLQFLRTAMARVRRYISIWTDYSRTSLSTSHLTTELWAKVGDGMKG